MLEATRPCRQFFQLATYVLPQYIAVYFSTFPYISETEND